jgi:hypothetical protein
MLGSSFTVALQHPEKNTMHVHGVQPTAVVLEYDLLRLFKLELNFILI